MVLIISNCLYFDSILIHIYLFHPEVGRHNLILQILWKETNEKYYYKFNSEEVEGWRVTFWNDHSRKVESNFSVAS